MQNSKVLKIVCLLFISTWHLFLHKVSKMFSWRLKCCEMRSIALHWDGYCEPSLFFFCFLTRPLNLTHTHSRTNSGPYSPLPDPYKTVKTRIGNVFLTKQKQIHGNLSPDVYTHSQAVWSPCLFRLPARAFRIPCPSASTQEKVTCWFAKW